MSERADYKGSGGAKSPPFDYEMVDRCVRVREKVGNGVGVRVRKRVRDGV